MNNEHLFSYLYLDQGGYVNAAERLLQKDVRDAYNTANDIINAETVLDKSKNARRKKAYLEKQKSSM